MQEHEWVELAQRAITVLLASEHAASWIEVEAKIADHPLEGFDRPIDPHHLTTARHVLTDAGLIDELHHKTRGGRAAPLLHLTNPQCNQHTFEAAVSRKALLYTRYIGWASGAPSRPGIIGRQGEAVVQASLEAAAAYGYSLLNPGGGELRNLYGREVPGGPLDNGAHLNIYDDDGRPSGHGVVLIEVKNIRERIYPSTKELYDLLYKAAAIQRAEPDTSFIPLLVTRRIQVPNTRKMAQELGFLVFDLERQFIAPTASLSDKPDDLRYLNEVRWEMGLIDLMAHDGPYQQLVDRFRRVLPSVLRRGAYPARWRDFAPVLVGEFLESRETTSPGQRRAALNDLRDSVRAHGGTARW